MGIRTTQYITRDSAIERIAEVSGLIATRNYRKLDQISFEPDADIVTFVATHVPYQVDDLELWTDRMLEEVMDSPFFRYSMFDNYIIKEVGA